MRFTPYNAPTLATKQARTLLTVKCDVDIPVDFDRLSHRSPDRTRLAVLFDRYGFRNWLKELDDVGEPAHVDADEILAVPFVARREFRRDGHQRVLASSGR